MHADDMLAAIVESAQDAIISHDLDGTILTWNRSAELMYGYTAAEAIGRHVSLILPPGSADEGAELMSWLADDSPIPTHEVVRRCKNGTLIEVALTISPIHDWTGEVVGASRIARDITEQRWMARTLDDTLLALESALDEARTSEALSRRFLADAAHQLRSPITGISACVQTLLRGAPEADRDNLMIHIVREASRASRLLGSLLRLARLDQGDDFAPGPSDLVALCRAEADRAGTLAPDLEIVVDTSGYPDRPRVVDPVAIQEILANLFDNARRHATGRIGLAIAETAGGVEVRMADDGPGMSPESATQAFERFVSLDGRGGSGLGLPIARALARAHGGDLVYADRAFVLRLPLQSDVGTPRATSSR